MHLVTKIIFGNGVERFGDQKIMVIKFDVLMKEKSGNKFNVIGEKK